jgi:hypothetical protein
LNSLKLQIKPLFTFTILDLFPDIISRGRRSRESQHWPSPREQVITARDVTAWGLVVDEAVLYTCSSVVCESAMRKQSRFTQRRWAFSSNGMETPNPRRNHKDRRELLGLLILILHWHQCYLLIYVTFTSSFLPQEYCFCFWNIASVLPFVCYHLLLVYLIGFSQYILFRCNNVNILESNKNSYLINYLIFFI